MSFFIDWRSGVAIYKHGKINVSINISVLFQYILPHGAGLYKKNGGSARTEPIKR